MGPATPLEPSFHLALCAAPPSCIGACGCRVIGTVPIIQWVSAGRLGDRAEAWHHPV